MPSEFQLFFQLCGNALFDITDLKLGFCHWLKGKVSVDCLDEAWQRRKQFCPWNRF